MIYSCLLCILSYLGISLFQAPLLNLIACAVCGLSVGIMWPGTFSKASAALPKGWNCYVCITGIRWRYGLCRRSYPGWNDFRFFGRQPENGHSGRNYLSGTAAYLEFSVAKKETPFHNVTCKESLPGHKIPTGFLCNFFSFIKIKE